MNDRPNCVINVHAHLHIKDDLDARVRLWREWNVRKVCCLSLHPKMREPMNGGFFTNEDFLRVKDRHPDILVGMGYLDFSPAGRDEPQTVDRLKEQGFVGLKVIAPACPLNHETYFPFYERAEALAMPILFHMGYVGQVKDGSDGRHGVNSDHMRPIYLDRIARAFPRLKMIGAHMGYPWCEEAACMMTNHANVFFDMSGGSGAKPHEYKMRRFFAPPAGADLRDEAEHPALRHFQKMCFGTDNPEPSRWIPVAQRILDFLGIPAATRERFWWRNAAEIFGWKDVSA